MNLTINLTMNILLSLPLAYTYTIYIYYIHIQYKTMCGFVGSDDVCAICICPLDNFDPTIVTRCKVRGRDREINTML
jgi:hypothetical protein